jgi:hypothetical protein
MLGDFPDLVRQHFVDQMQIATVVYKGSGKLFFQTIAEQLDIPTTEPKLDKDGEAAGAVGLCSLPGLFAPPGCSYSKVNPFSDTSNACTSAVKTPIVSNSCLSQLLKLRGRYSGYFAVSKSHNNFPCLCLVMGRYQVRR